MRSIPVGIWSTPWNTIDEPPVRLAVSGWWCTDSSETAPDSYVSCSRVGSRPLCIELPFLVTVPPAGQKQRSRCVSHQDGGSR